MRLSKNESVNSLRAKNARSPGGIIRCKAAKMDPVAIGSAGLRSAPLINGCWQLAGGHGQEVFKDINSKLSAHADAGFTTFE